MIKFCSTALTIFVFGSCLFADQPVSSTEKAVAAAEKQWQQAVLGSNQSTLMNLMAEDITYTHSNATIQTRQEFIESVVSGSTKYQTIDFKTTQMRQYGKAVVSIHDTLIVTAQTGVSHLYITHVWSERNGRWQMVSRQATKIPEAAK